METPLNIDAGFEREDERGDAKEIEHGPFVVVATRHLRDDRGIFSNVRCNIDFTDEFGRQLFCSRPIFPSKLWAGILKQGQFKFKSKQGTTDFNGQFKLAFDQPDLNDPKLDCIFSCCGGEGGCGAVFGINGSFKDVKDHIFNCPSKKAALEAEVARQAQAGQALGRIPIGFRYNPDILNIGGRQGGAGQTPLTQARRRGGKRARDQGGEVEKMSKEEPHLHDLIHQDLTMAWVTSTISPDFYANPFLKRGECDDQIISIH